MLEVCCEGEVGIGSGRECVCVHRKYVVSSGETSRLLLRLLCLLRKGLDVGLRSCQTTGCLRLLTFSTQSGRAELFRDDRDAPSCHSKNSEMFIVASSALLQSSTSSFSYFRPTIMPLLTDHPARDIFTYITTLRSPFYSVSCTPDLITTASRRVTNSAPFMQRASPDAQKQRFETQTLP